jgi:hypothetical protein
MKTQLLIQDVCDRGFKNAASLAPEERLVYLLADLEALIDMEGWDHFFMTDRMQYYPDLISGLRAAGDSVSVEVLQDYEQHFGGFGVSFEPEAIAKFLSEERDGYISSCRDWQRDFELAKETRWKKIEEYLSHRGYEIAG